MTTAKTTTTSSPTTIHLLKLSLLLFSTALLAFFFILFQLLLSNKPPSIPSYPPPLPSHQSNSLLLAKLRNSVTFLPLKDLRFSRSPASWFISSINDTQPPEDDHSVSKYLFFPSASSQNRILCLQARNQHDGSKNLYAFAYPEALPYNSTLLNGLTFVSDTFYDYTNPWHGLGAIVPFVAWHEKNKCAKPERWVLFHWGELRTDMGDWVRRLAGASTGNEVKIENFEEYYGNEAAVCFDKALVFRHNEGGISKEGREKVYDWMRCKAREYCNIIIIDSDEDLKSTIRVTVLLRVGGRSFKNETVVVGVFDKECSKVEGCRLKVARSNNLTFCDQVKLMTDTDILISAHGAQLTNMIFMNKNSSILEFFPKGWLELAGVGQYVFQWQADWMGMRHRGQWRDQIGDKCPYDNNADCFTFYKDGNIGHDEAFFAIWMASVLKEVKEQKLNQSSKSSSQGESACPCEAS